MRDQLIALLAETSAVDLPDTEAAEVFRIAWLGRKGRMKDLMAAFKEAPNEEKRELGKLLNELKGSIEERIESVASQGARQPGSGSSGEDLTRPAGGRGIGTHHPLSVVRREIIGIFERMGFIVSEGPEIEDDWHVFSGLNFPEEHPARDMQDTFFVDRNPDLLLRTHTSSVQVREMEQHEPPMRLIMPGRVFRNEAISARAHCMFHQIEGLYIDEGVSFADLKQTLLLFAQEFFGPETRIRL
ncbi:phenylalanine--tRNA ligase subunit alpha, partial [Flavobacteriales bacterium]|nr:phenylalanine--tRNA ligase subunit alpha [Flavobacteriales bacterium]